MKTESLLRFTCQNSAINASPSRKPSPEINASFVTTISCASLYKRMRFLIEYKDTKTKDETHRNLKALDTFLNYHLIEIFHGWTFECIIIRFINHPKSNKKLKCKTIYNTYAEIEIASNFDSNSELSLEQFLTAFDNVKIAASLANEIKTKSKKNYDLLKLSQDLNSLKTPTSIDELIELENSF